MSEPWRTILVILVTALASHFGVQGVQAPKVKGSECAKLLMNVASGCENCR